MFFCIVVPTDHNRALRKGSSWLECFSVLPCYTYFFVWHILGLSVAFFCIWEVRSRLFGGRAKKLLPCLKAVTERVGCGSPFCRRWPDTSSIYYDILYIRYYIDLYCICLVQNKIACKLESRPLLSKSQQRDAHRVAGAKWNSLTVKVTS